MNIIAYLCRQYEADFMHTAALDGNNRLYGKEHG